MKQVLRYQKSRFQTLLTPDSSLVLESVREVAAEQGLPLYLVGGFVRDLLLGQPGSDFDLVVEGDAIRLAKAVAERLGGRVTPHHRFGTAKWFLAGSALGARLSRPILFLDFVLARSETYAHPSALPAVRPGTLSDDLRRRDFTINTLAIRLDGEHYGELRDDLGGLEDLQKGLVRVLHPRSFTDDPTRILRAVRYEQRYGFRIPASDLDLIARARPLVADLSADRIRHEMNLILAEENSAGMLARGAGLGLLASVHPSLPWDRNIAKTMETGLAAEFPRSWGHLPEVARLPRRVALGYLLWLMRLSDAHIRALDARLHFPAALRETLQAAARLWRDLDGLVTLKPSQVYARLDGVAPLAVYASYLATGRAGKKTLGSYLETWRHIAPRTRGEDLTALGLTPGPAFQRILWTLRAAWLDGSVTSVAEERALLGRLAEHER